MDDELDVLSDETPDTPEPAPEAPSSESVDYWRKRAEKAEQQAVARRVELRRYEAAAKHGVAASEIPDWVPAEKLEEFVSAYVAKAGTTEPDPTEEAKPEPEAETAPDPAAERLAAVAGQAPGTQSSPTTPSAKELFEKYQSDPAEATRQAIAKYRAKQQ